MDMDGTGPAVIGKGVGTVGKSVVVHKVAPDRVCGGDDGAARSGGGLVFRRVVSGVIFRCGWSLWCAGPASMVQGMVSQPFIWSLSA